MFMTILLEAISGASLANLGLRLQLPPQSLLLQWVSAASVALRLSLLHVSPRLPVTSGRV